jgi:hypothetical protein
MCELTYRSEELQIMKLESVSKPDLILSLESNALEGLDNIHLWDKLVD